jgi:hypothetical protein
MAVRKMALKPPGVNPLTVNQKSARVKPGRIKLPDEHAERRMITILKQ